MLSNCLIEALKHYVRLRLQGVRVTMWFRKSDAKYSPFHCGWAIYDSPRAVYVPYSFKPVKPKLDVPIYMAWTRLLFVGTVVKGDHPP